MVILIASDNPQIRRGLAERLRQRTGHRILKAGGVEEMESVGMSEESLDLLVFSPALSESGRDSRARLRAHFPELRTVVLQEPLPLEESVAQLLEWAAPAESTADTEFSVGTESLAGPETPVGIEMPVITQTPELFIAIGDYFLRELTGSTATTLIYKAVQRSVERPVTLERLKPEFAADSAEAHDFRRLGRARALVAHPAIEAVYEAQENGEVIFHTRELIRGENLFKLAALGIHFPQTVVLSVLQTVADALVWMEEHDIPYKPLLPEHIYIGPNHTTRVVNLASAEAERREDAVDSLGSLAEVCLQLAKPRGGHTRELAHVLGLMESPGSHGIHTWSGLARETRSALQRLTEAHTSRVPESRNRTKARRRRQGMAVKWAAAAFLLVAAVFAVVTWVRHSALVKVRPVEELVRIPAGTFLFRDGKVTTLPEFWIDRYEVTLAQYAAFLETLVHGPENRFDHPEQPATKTSHAPKDWIEIHAAAKKAGPWRGHLLTLNSPIFNVDWWDAWAYAKWKDRRLPTEEEWEKAARGEKGLLWLSGTDSSSNPAGPGGKPVEPPKTAAGKDDGLWWRDVDAVPGDISPYGVYGLAGNVAEWTATLVPDPDLPDVEVPVFRGGDFHQPVPVPLNAGPWLAKSALYVQPFLGFRTASSTAPPD